MSTQPAPPVSTTSAPMDGFWHDTLAEADPQIHEAIRNELARQQDKIELIASENIASRAVLEATGSDMAKACLTAFLDTEFAGGRHQRRVDKLSNPEI